MDQRKNAIEPTGSGDAKTAWLRTGANCMLEIGPDGAQKDIVTDGKGSVVATGGTGGLKIRGYMAYGYAPAADSAQSTLGYNGEYTDPVTGNYHLGNGYRAFSPTLNRFTAPDSLSPFGGGGLNTYAYCAGDPINAIDPTGHIKWWQWAIVGVSSAFALASVAFDGAEIFAAIGAVLKFAQIAEDAAAVEGAGEIAATATRLSTVSRAWHGIFAVKNVGSSILQGAIDSETTFKKKSLVVNGHLSTLGILQFANFAVMATNVSDLLYGATSSIKASGLRSALNTAAPIPLNPIGGAADLGGGLGDVSRSERSLSSGSEYASRPASLRLDLPEDPNPFLSRAQQIADQHGIPLSMEARPPGVSGEMHYQIIYEEGHYMTIPEFRSGLPIRVPQRVAYYLPRDFQNTATSMISDAAVVEDRAVARISSSSSSSLSRRTIGRLPSF
jgi:RHS repeat-associated protein